MGGHVKVRCLIARVVEVERVARGSPIPGATGHLFFVRLDVAFDSKVPTARDERVVPHLTRIASGRTPGTHLSSAKHDGRRDVHQRRSYD